MEIHRSDATLGAQVYGVDLSKPLSDTEFAEIETAWNEYAVLIFSGQGLADAAHIDFTLRFGRLEQSIRRSTSNGLSRLSNVDANGAVVRPSSLQARFLVGNTYWHSDSSYKRVGAKASILAAHVVPEDGGETEWADMRAGYEVLQEEMKVWLDGKIAVHSYEFSHAPFGGMEILNVDELARLGAVRHPVVRVHPVTGRRNLFVGRHASHIVGQDLGESRRLLAKLTEDAAQPPRTLKHKWRVGDLVIWDNRCVLHRGHRWPNDQARTMIRTTVAGEDPSNEWVLAETA